jgi:hypothetical protein
MVSASPSSRASTASVVLLRVPLSFPAGLPLFPGSKGISGIASVLHFQLSARIPARSSRQHRANRTKGEHQGPLAAYLQVSRSGVLMIAHRGKFIAYYRVCWSRSLCLPLSIHILAAVAQAANRAAADGFAANVLPVIHQIQASGVQSLRGVARALSARGVKTARGGEWSAVQVADILRRQ